MNPPKFVRNIPPYRVHWNWELSYRCNYQCSYCPWWKKGKGEGHTVFENMEMDAWKMIWHRIFEYYWCCHIRFSGGEPTIYPHFFDLVAILLEKHTVDITTNLSFDISAFMKKVRPGGISISASFHPEFVQIEPFLEKVLFLQQNGYPSTIAYVAYPPHLKEIQNFKSWVEKKGIMFKIIPFQGQWQGKHYPQDYTIQERCLMQGLSTDSLNTHLNQLNSRWYEWNVKKDKLEKQKKGNLCRMGQMYAKINPDGKVYRCCAVDKDGAFVGFLGNITDSNLRLLEVPLPCEADNCPCFKSMLVDCEEDRWLPLWEAAEHPIYKTEYIKEFLENDNAKSMSQATFISNSSRQSIPPHRVFYTWDIHYACNYRCSYCYFAKEWDVKAKENRYIPIEKWMRIWDDIFERYGSGHIHISGGEPFMYPSFIDLIAYLTKKHTVEFDTNLSFDVAEFMSKVKPERVKFATAFHPEFTDLDSYLRKTLLLKENGYDLGINYVAYPPQLEKIREYKDIFGNKHISFDIMPFRGEYQSRSYPKEYIEEEKALIENCDPQTAPKMLASYGGDKKCSRKGKICRMGQMYTKIHPDGTAYRCCFIDDRGKLGNLIDGTFSLYEEPRSCEYDECSCWVAMIMGEEKDWLFHWAIPKQA